MTPTSIPAEPRTWGLLAEYDDPQALLRAAATVRDAGITRWDCCTPFPVHGLDRAMGMKKTILPWLVLGAGLTGLTVAAVMQWYVNSPHTASAATGWFSGYPLVFSGKPYWSLPANIPVMFEVTVLLSSLTAFFGVWALSGLPRLHHPLFTSRRFRRVTDDKFFLVIEAQDPQFDRERTLALLKETQPSLVEELQD
ncbi:MAG: DUF3341 domain-containing protein [Phycisphaerae bacterium]